GDDVPRRAPRERGRGRGGLAASDQLSREVLVLHLPGVIHDVKGAVADEERQRPRPHPFPLAAVIGPHRRDVRLPVSAPTGRGERATLRAAPPRSPRGVSAGGGDGGAGGWLGAG